MNLIFLDLLVVFWYVTVKCIFLDVVFLLLCGITTTHNRRCERIDSLVLVRLSVTREKREREREREKRRSEL